MSSPTIRVCTLERPISPPSARRERVCYKNRVKIQTLRHEAGWSYPHIGIRMGILTSTVYDVANTPATPRKPQGRHAMIDEEKLARPVGFITSSSDGRRMSYKQLGQHCRINANDCTIQRALSSAGYHRCIAVRKPFLNERAKTLRLAWARRYQHYTKDDWARVFSQTSLPCMSVAPARSL